MHQSPGVVDSLPVFYEAAADRLTFPMSWSSGGYDNFELWRTTARRKVVDCLFAPPPPAPYDVEIVAAADDSRVMSLADEPLSLGLTKAVIRHAPALSARCICDTRAPIRH